MTARSARALADRILAMTSRRCCACSGRAVVVAALLSLGVYGGPGGFLAGTAEAQPPGAQAQPPWVGLWSGRSIISEKVLDDAVRKLTRSSDADFWFVVDAEGQVRGEGFVTYSAELKAVKWSVPVPSGGSIDAEVEGSSGKIVKRFDIRGRLIDTPGREHLRDHRDCSFSLRLEAVGRDEAGKPAVEVDATIPGIVFDFTIEARVNVPTMGALPAAAPGLQVISIPAKGWSPFQGLAPTVERGPGEPMRVMAENQGDRHYILWYAVQQSL